MSKDNAFTSRPSGGSLDNAALDMMSDTIIENAKGNYISVALDNIVPDPEQPRKTFEDNQLNDLAASLQEVGQIQPIIVRKSNEHGKYILVVGERRWRSAPRAGLDALDCAVLSDSDEDRIKILTIQYIENDQRADVNPIERAATLEELKTLLGSADAVAEKIGRSKAVVSKLLALNNDTTFIKRVSMFTNDFETLYEFNSLKNADSSVAEKVLSDFEQGGLEEGGLREKIREIKKEIQHNKTGKKPSKKVTLSRLMPVKNIDLSQDGEKHILSIEKGKETLRFSLSLDQVKSLTNHD